MSKELEHVLFITSIITQEKYFFKLYKQLRGGTQVIWLPSLAQLSRLLILVE